MFSDHVYVLLPGCRHRVGTQYLLLNGQRHLVTRMEEKDAHPSSSACHRVLSQRVCPSQPSTQAHNAVNPTALQSLPSFHVKKKIQSRCKWRTKLRKKGKSSSYVCPSPCPAFTVHVQKALQINHDVFPSCCAVRSHLTAPEACFLPSWASPPGLVSHFLRLCLVSPSPAEHSRICYLLFDIFRFLSLGDVRGKSFCGL